MCPAWIQAARLAGGKTVLRRRPLSCFSRSSSRRAHTNSAARTPRPIKMTSEPGAGVRIIIMPTARSVKPKRIFTNRLACWSVLKSISPASGGRCGPAFTAYPLLSCRVCRARSKKSPCTSLANAPALLRNTYALLIMDFVLSSAGQHCFPFQMWKVFCKRGMKKWSF